MVLSTSTARASLLTGLVGASQQGEVRRDAAVIVAVELPASSTSTRSRRQGAMQVHGSCPSAIY